MKNITVIILLLAFLFSCEDVVEVGIPTSEPRLIIDALIRVDETLQTTKVSIRASVTTSFFEDPQPAVLTNLQIRDELSGGAFFPAETFPGSGGV